MAKKCSSCGAELISLLTSTDTCPNNCDRDQVCNRYGRMLIDGVRCDRSNLGVMLTNRRWTDVFINASEIKEIHDTLCIMANNKIDDKYFIYTPQPIVFEYFQEGNSLRITHGRLADKKRDVFHVFFQEDMMKLIEFLSP